MRGTIYLLFSIWGMKGKDWCDSQNPGCHNVLMCRVIELFIYSIFITDPLYVLYLICKRNMYLISHILIFINLPLYWLRKQGKYLFQKRLKSATLMCDGLNICRRLAKIIHWVMVLTTLYSIYNNFLNKGFLAGT